MPKEERQIAFRIAAVNGDIEALQRIYDEEPSVLDSTDPVTRNTALHLTVIHGNLEAFVLLIQLGAKVNIFNKARKLPLHYAFDKRHYAMRIVLKEFANDAILSNVSETCDLKDDINAAAQRQLAGWGAQADLAEKIIQHILSAGSVTSLLDGIKKITNYQLLYCYGFPLMTYSYFFSEVGKVDIVKSFILDGFDINAKTTGVLLLGFECGLLHASLANEMHDEFRQIVDFCFDNKDKVIPIDFKSRDGEGKTLLHMAVKIRSVDTVNFILQKMKDPASNLSRQDIADIINSIDIYGIPLLHIAFILGSKGIFDLLVSHGADVNIKDKHGKTLKDIFKNEEVLKKRCNLLLDSIEINPERDSSAPCNDISYLTAIGKIAPISISGKYLIYTKANLPMVLNQLRKDRPVRRDIIAQLESVSLSGHTLKAVCAFGRQMMRNDTAFMSKLSASDPGPAVPIALTAAPS
jgi:ankyrin repeat protein